MAIVLTVLSVLGGVSTVVEVAMGFPQLRALRGALRATRWRLAERLDRTAMNRMPVSQVNAHLRGVLLMPEQEAAIVRRRAHWAKVRRVATWLWRDAPPRRRMSSQTRRRLRDLGLNEVADELERMKR
jgi:hypothetical protein